MLYICLEYEFVINKQSQNQTHSDYSMPKSQISAQSFETFIQSIKKGHIIELLQLHPFYENIILPILQSRPSLVTLYRIHLEDLLNAIYNKLQLLPKHQAEVFPGIFMIIQQIKNAIGPFKRVKKTQLGLPVKDNYFLNFLKDQQVRLDNHDNSSYYDLLENQRLNQQIKVRMPILISSRNFSKDWQTPFTAIRQQFKAQKDKSLASKSFHSYSEFKVKQVSLPMCLGCTQYYYERVNIRYLQFHQVDVIVLSKIKELNNHKDLLKNSICALLNSGGGILLFDCVEEYMQVLPVGTFISEKEKELFMQQISQMFKYFCPKISFGINIELKFIPIAQNPFQNFENASSVEYIKGKYVTRLRVWNNQRWRLYSYDPSSNQNVAYTRKGGATIKLSGRQLVRQIKHKFNKYYCPEICNRQVFSRSQNIFQNHQCIEPRMGIPLQNKQKDRKQELTQYDLQNSYNYVSFVFLRNIEFQRFEIRLKHNFNSPLVLLPHSPPTADNFCLLFHDTAHRDLKNHFENVCDDLMRRSRSNNQRSYNQRPIMLFVENGLKLTKKIEEKDFKDLIKYIKNKNSTQTLKYFEGRNEYYLTSQFKVTLFFLFAKLRDLNFYNTTVERLDISQLENDVKFKIIEAHNV